MVVVERETEARSWAGAGSPPLPPGRVAALHGELFRVPEGLGQSSGFGVAVGHCQISPLLPRLCQCPGRG